MEEVGKGLVKTSALKLLKGYLFAHNLQFLDDIDNLGTVDGVTNSRTKNMNGHRTE